MQRRAFIIGLAAAASVAAASCATRAFTSGAGYSEQRLGETAWRIAFAGSTFDSPESVEGALLRRAGALTLQSGYDWFAPKPPTPPAEAEIVVEAARPTVNASRSVWRPRWRRRSRQRWTDWDPRGGAREDAASTESASASSMPARYAASVEITMGRGDAPAGSFAARDVLSEHSD